MAELGSFILFHVSDVGAARDDNGAIHKEFGLTMLPF